ncbi:dehydrogenase [Fulvimarina endophytica]|uniref:Dehydrogenase n=1 Tax=Fulvimarina endophytica TaxID=2293836 RepID=A0A371X3E1_9HYPH|nr:dehydrogenase [Fulvimarina endophytica]
MDAHALWLEAPNHPALRPLSLPAPGPSEALVAARFSAISRGTERLVSAGQVPPSEYERMRAPFQSGEFPFPVSYGYCLAGLVEDGPPGWLGRSVFCLCPHQSHAVLPVEALRPVPEDVPLSRAVLAANMETALNIVWDASVQPGDTVAVVGAGTVGLLTAYFAAAIPGTSVTLVDIDDAKAGPARALGLSFVGPDSAPSDCDIVIHASASASGLSTAIACAGFEARIVEASWYGERAIEVPLGGAFHSRRLSLIGSQVGHLPSARRARWTHARRLDLALSLLADERLDVLISGETPFAELPGAYLGILDDPATLCHRIRYEKA